jgi:hypothetical protein
MTDLKISVDNPEPEQKGVSSQNIKDTLSAADEYEKVKAENDKLEAEYNRRIELKAKMEQGGRALAGQVEKTEQQKAEEEATIIRKQFR